MNAQHFGMSLRNLAVLQHSNCVPTQMQHPMPAMLACNKQFAVLHSASLKHATVVLARFPNFATFYVIDSGTAAFIPFVI